MSDLSALKERLEQASGPDRELDLLVGELWPEEPNRPFNLSLVAIRNGKPVCPEFTASIDAALGLVERKLPYREKTLWHDRENSVWGVHLTDDVWDEANGHIGAAAPTAPLAILIALVSALIAQEQEG